MDRWEAGPGDEGPRPITGLLLVLPCLEQIRKRSLFHNNLYRYLLENYYNCPSYNTYAANVNSFGLCTV